MAELSPYCPLLFPEGKDDGYRQVFAPTDRILLQVFGLGGGSASVIDSETGAVLSTTPFESKAVGETAVQIAEISGLTEGWRQIELPGIGKNLPFLVTSDEGVLGNTLLIQYFNDDNRRTDKAAFLVDGEQLAFGLRIEGGFKDSETEFGVEVEQFEDFSGDIVELSAIDKASATATIGNASGVSPRMGEILSLALSCSELYVNGEKMCYGGGELQGQSVGESTELVIYKAKLAKAVNISPADELARKDIIMRKLEDAFRKADSDAHRLVER